MTHATGPDLCCGDVPIRGGHETQLGRDGAAGGVDRPCQPGARVALKATFRDFVLPSLRSCGLPIGYGSTCLRATRVRQLPACERGAAASRGSLFRLLRFVTENRPPRTSLPETSAELRKLGTSIRVLQQRLTKLTALIKAKDLARVKAMVGSDAPPARRQPDLEAFPEQYADGGVHTCGQRPRGRYPRFEARALARRPEQKFTSSL